MKKIRIVVIVVVCVLLLGWIVDTVLKENPENPVSRAIIRFSAEQYLKENHPDSDYRIKYIAYSDKREDYHVQIISDKSKDSYFEMFYNHIGKLCGNLYNRRVANKGNTFGRISREYTDAVNAVSFSIPDAEDVRVSGRLGGRSSHPMYDKENYIDSNTLELDASYDLSILGAQAGIISLHVDLRSAKSATPANLAQILLYVRKTLDEAELPFYEIDCYFDFPSDKFPRRIVLRDYLYEDIYEEGFEARLTEAINSQN